MAISKADAEKMRRLAREGKRIAKIAAEDFPDLDYWDVYGEIYGAGVRGALGAKRMVTTRLKALAARASKEDQKRLDEVDDLVWLLYESLKQNQQKLDKVRRALGE